MGTRYTIPVNFLKNLQSKSSTTKAQYAFGIASGITMVIAIVWVSTLPAQFARLSPEEGMNDESMDDVTDFLADTKNQVGNVIDATDMPESIETNNLDALNMYEPVPENREEVQPEPVVEEEIQDEPVMQEEVPKTSPKVILIGTTTSQKTE